MILYLDFPNNTILSCYLFFLLINDLYCLIPVVITQIFNPTVELAISTKEAKAEMETHPVTADTKTSNFSR